MSHSIDIRTGRHVIYSLHAHLVFVTKYSKKVFNKKMLEYLKTTFEGVCNDFDSILVEFDGEHDHVHLMIEYRPKFSLAKIVNSLKGVSSRMLRQEFKEHIEKFYWKGVLWSPSYFAGSCGGAPITVVKQYIQNQKTPLS